jgi:hypothetical protein
VLVPSVPRAIGIIACAVVLFVPQAGWYRCATYDTLNVVALLHFAFPVAFYILVNLCIDEGRERAEREREKCDTKVQS